MLGPSKSPCLVNIVLGLELTCLLLSYLPRGKNQLPSPLSFHIYSAQPHCLPALLPPPACEHVEDRAVPFTPGSPAPTTVVLKK